MSAKPWFKARNGWAVELDANGWGVFPSRDKSGHRVRVTDAREMTAEKAVEMVVQHVLSSNMDYPSGWIKSHAKAAGMTATVKNGRVKVRRAT